MTSIQPDGPQLSPTEEYPTEEALVIRPSADQDSTVDDVTSRFIMPTRRDVLVAPLAFLAGIGAGYLMWNRALAPAPVIITEANLAADATSAVSAPTDVPVTTPATAHLPEQYTLPVVFGDVGPRLIEAGAIDLPRFLQVYQQAGQPLTMTQRAILTDGSDAEVLINQQNAYFLLNFFWALGLANHNPLLTEGLIAARSEGKIERFASTGGWSLATKPIADVFAKTTLVALTPDQQTRLEEAVGGIYRPCCDNPTSFPDCNHGMAMLGLLELMAAKDASIDAMLDAARYVNAFWFPQQMHEIATLLKVTEGIDYANADARRLVSANYASGSGFNSVHNWLVSSGNLGTPASDGNSCGV